MIILPVLFVNWERQASLYTSPRRPVITTITFVGDLVADLSSPDITFVQQAFGVGRIPTRRTVSSVQ